jgi:hypothetical protein
MQIEYDADFPNTYPFTDRLDSLLTEDFGNTNLPYL